MFNNSVKSTKKVFQELKSVRKSSPTQNMHHAETSQQMLLVDKKFVFLIFINNLFFCPKLAISTIHLISLMKQLKIVGILQNFEICTKFVPSATQFYKGFYCNLKNRPRK